jgi:hypothetical protein
MRVRNCSEKQAMIDLKTFQVKDENIAQYKYNVSMVLSDEGFE